LQHSDADHTIHQEFGRGKKELLASDKWLLTSRRETLKKPLMEKQRWVAMITGARAAWQHKQQEQPNYNNERGAIQDWLLS
jgi:hypothetical protein